MSTTDDDLTRWLEASIGGVILSKYALPSEAKLHQVHAQLERGIREQRRFTIQEMKHGDRTGDDAR